MTAKQQSPGKMTSLARSRLFATVPTERLRSYLAHVDRCDGCLWPLDRVTHEVERYCSPMASHPFVAETDSGGIHGRVEGDGPTLLLLHGGPGMSDYLDFLGDEIDGFQAIHFQQRGLAPSTIDGPFNVDRHVADSLSVLNHLKVRRALVLGHSWGGHLALALALTAPERITALLIVDPPGSSGDAGLAAMGAALEARLSPESRTRAAQLAARSEGSDETDADATEGLAIVWPGYFADPSSAPPFPAQIVVSAACYGGTINSMLEQISEGSFVDGLGGLLMPAEFVLGAASPLAPENGAASAARMPNAVVNVVPGAGHFPWIEAPGCVAEALARLSESSDRS
jgi:proline iminopeptidase